MRVDGPSIISGGMIMMQTLLASAAAVAFGAEMVIADYTLTILYTNDFHARFKPVSKYDSGCGDEDNADGNCFGGLAPHAPSFGLYT